MAFQIVRPSDRSFFAKDAVLLKGFALPDAKQLLSTAADVAQQAPFRHMTTKRGFALSARMTNCGQLGWVSDKKGYRYTSDDPETMVPWPPMPELFFSLAVEASKEAGFGPFTPDACLINEYVPGSKMSLHRDEDEQDLNAPIVSVSLGLPALFLFGGNNREDLTTRVLLEHGDVVVWGRSSRLAYHGIMPIKGGALFGFATRINLTFRKAGQSPTQSEESLLN